MKYQKGVLQTRQSSVVMFTRFSDLIIIFFSSILVSSYFTELGKAESYLAAFSSMLVFYAICEFQNFYVSWRTTPFRIEFRKLSIIWFFSFLTVISFESFVNLDIFTSSAHQFYWFLSTWFLLISYRRILKSLLHYIRSRGFSTQKVAIVGYGRLGQELSTRISSSPWMGLQVFGFYDLPGFCQSEGVSLDMMKGDLSDLILDAQSGKFEKVYIALPVSKQSHISDIVNELSDTTCSVFYLPDIFTFELLNSRSDNLAGLPIISIYSSPMDSSNRILKRFFDLLVGSIILTIILLPMIVIGFAVKLTSRGPALFKQHRYGIDGIAINVWKFRTMDVMENSNIVTQAKKGDSRLTSIGGFLRRTSLDELPQFINVIQGSMSIVGPRPHAVAHNEEYRKLINGYMLRHLVKPGITGWANYHSNM